MVLNPTLWATHSAERLFGDLLFLANKLILENVITCIKLREKILLIVLSSVSLNVRKTRVGCNLVYKAKDPTAR